MEARDVLKKKPLVNRDILISKLKGEKITEQEGIFCLVCLLHAAGLLDCLDKIDGTDFYRHEIKQAVKKLQPLLEKYVGAPMADIFKVDADALQGMYEHKKALTVKIAAYRPEVHAGLNELINVYLQQPELTLHRLGIVVPENPLNNT